MDRVATARAGRRRQAQDALDFERDRAAALRQQLDAIVLELEGAGVDEGAFAKMDPEDVALVRGDLQGGPAMELEGLEEEWLDFTGVSTEADEVDERQEHEAEIARIEQEIEASGRRQAAFERYLEALGE